VHTTLVSTSELARQPEWRVFDCRHDLARPELGGQQYREAHIPGALFAHLDRDLSARPNGANGRHPLPGAELFCAWLGRQGLEPDDQVVCYDAGNGTVAARLWWMLRWVGHEAVAVLDGGISKWITEGRPVTREQPRFAPTAYRAHARAGMQADAASVRSRLGSRDLLLLDARAAQRWRGEAEPIDPVAGRIPGALNRYCAENLSAHGTFKDAQALRREFLDVLGGAAPAQVVNYCGSGVAACHNLLAMEIAGLAGAKLYAGSWSEWIADPARPRESG
jgi:thiosulfate/3-mercaptopyruvate sulfurtransferase